MQIREIQVLLQPLSWSFWDMLPLANIEAFENDLIAIRYHMVISCT